jgi:hypothetical protein
MNLRSLFIVLLSVGLSTVTRAQVNFSDNFSPPTNLWNNASGNWTASGGEYFAQQPNNNPFAVTWLPYDLTDFTITVHVNALADGGILLRGSGLGGGTPTGPPHTIVCILGGNNYGQGGRGGNAGTSSYWHVDGSGAMNEVDGVFVPGTSYDVKVTAVGNTYSIYINGSTTPLNTLTTSLNAHGYVGLYDDQPNTTTGSGSGPIMSYSNFTLVGTLYRPTLGIFSAGLTQATLFWPTNSSDWTLQSNTSLTLTNWVPVPTTPVVVGTNYTVTVSDTVGQQFFRLQQN